MKSNVKTKVLFLYSTEEDKLQQQDAVKEIEEYRIQIYQKHENSIDEVWNPETRQIYVESFEQEPTQTIHINGQTYPEHLREHLDMVMMVNIINETKPMILTEITESEVEVILRKLKNKKAPGTDQIKPELYKSLANNKVCLKEITKCYNNLLNDKEIPDDWKISTTKMIPQKGKPTAKDLRPIALLYCSHKIFMSIVKEKIEQQLLCNDEIKEAQAGFTKGRRIEDNIMILQYCVEESYRRKKPLIVTAVDFSKAYDYKKGQPYKCSKEI